MQKPTSHNSDEVSIDDLLRLKRSEKPNRQFWDQFDHELHQRMLQTLVKKESWYLQVWNRLTSINSLTQIAGLTAAAVVVSLFLIGPSKEPTLVTSSPLEDTLMSPDFSSEVMVEADYDTDAIFVHDALKIEQGVDFDQDYTTDIIQLAQNQSSDYSADSIPVRAAFGQTGIASLVF
jgi:hypothetical protein